MTFFSCRNASSVRSAALATTRLLLSRSPKSAASFHCVSDASCSTRSELGLGLLAGTLY